MPDDYSGKDIKQKTIQDGSQGEAVYTPPPPDNPPTPPAQPITDKGVESAIHAVEDSVKRAEWLMIGLTAAIVVLTLGSVIVGILQWRVMSGQLREMKSGGVDTGHLVEAAQKQAAANVQQVGAFAAVAIEAKVQADGTEHLAERMKDQANHTKVIAEQAVVQAGEAKRLAQTSIDTLNNTQSAFQTEQRAWIGVQDAVGNAFTETTPWRLRVIFFNSGRAPARSVQRAAMYITSGVPLSAPAAEHIKQLTFDAIQSIAPQGRYNLDMGTSPPAHASTASQRQGTETLLSQYKQIRDGTLFLY